MALVKGWSEPTIYADEGISGTKETRKRPQLARLMADVTAGAIQAVIILDLSRLARKTRLVLDLVDEMSRAGVSLVSCKESLDTTTPQGQFVLTLFAALAQLERDQIAERTRAALAEHGRRDGEKGGRMPYGYQRSASSVTGIALDRHGAAVVRRIFALRERGSSLREIAEQLNVAGEPGPRGGAWLHTGVKAILDNSAVYRGGVRGESAVRWPVILQDLPDSP